MKKLLLTILLSSPFLINAANIYEAKDHFIRGEKKHKNECLKMESDFMAAKFDLIRKQHDEMFDLKLKGLEKLKTQGFSESLLKECLAEKVALCERHLEEWKKLCEAHQARGEEFYRKSKAMLDSFKQEYMGVTGGYYRGYESTAKSENPNFLERALDMLKGKLDI